MASFAERLKELRKSKGMTQEKFAENFFITKSAVSKYENGINTPESKLLQDMADFFGVSTDYLLGRSNEKNLSLFSGTGNLSKAFESFKQNSDTKLNDSFSIIISKILIEEGLYSEGMSYEEKVVLAEKVVSVLKLIQDK